MDSYGKKAGKGALIQEEKSATLGVSQDQILFQAIESHPQDSRYNLGEINQPLSANMEHDPMNGGGVLMVKKSIGFMRGLGGVQTMNEKMPTLQAANGMSGNNKPCVAYGVTTKGNGDAFVSEERHTSLSTGGGEAGQGYPCVMTAVGVDMYNQSITGDVAKTHTTGRNDKSNIPCVVTFEPGIASRDGGHVYENVSGTLRATPGDNQMTVAYDIGEARLRNPQEYVEKSPTLTARCGTGGNNVPAVVFENHAQDSRYKGPLEVAQPVTATYGMGGNNQPLVICLQGNGIDRADTAGCNGKGWTEDVSYTLNTIDRPAVVYTVDEKIGQEDE